MRRATFTTWCDDVEAVLGHDIPNADGYDPNGPTVHELAAWHEAGTTAHVAARLIEAAHTR